MSDMIGKLSIFSLVIAFIIYVVIHIGIGAAQKNFQKALEKKPKDVELTKNLKRTTLLFNWFPAIYVIIAIVVMYF